MYLCMYLSIICMVNILVYAAASVCVCVCVCVCVHALRKVSPDKHVRFINTLIIKSVYSYIYITEGHLSWGRNNGGDNVTCTNFTRTPGEHYRDSVFYCRAPNWYSCDVYRALTNHYSLTEWTHFSARRFY